MLAGGDGRGGAPIAAGVIASNGLPASPTAFGASGTLLNGTFSPLNGLGGRPNRPRVEGVLVPRNLTPLAPGLSRTFPAAGGGYWDAIRNAGTIFASGVVAPIILADKPGISRPGIGMHADSGVTFDLAEIRAAEGGRPIHRLTGICGYSINGCITSDLHEEFLILVDGQERFRRLICTQATLAWPFDVAISASDRYLTLISLNADGNTCDHLAVADAVLTISSALDDDGDGTLDSCACPADFNGDGGVDGADVEAFYRAWESGETSADVNHDGGIDGADVETFFAAWEAGGC